MDDSTDDKPQRPRRERSLLARALGYLARREHSRAELARKLAPHAESRAVLDALLADLEARKLLSEERFAEVLVRSRGERFGAARVKQELRAHGVGDPLVRAAMKELAASELQRARAVWQRRFGVPPGDARQRAQQMRFLAQRGFSTEVIRKLVGGRGGDDD